MNRKVKHSHVSSWRALKAHALRIMTTKMIKIKKMRKGVYFRNLLHFLFKIFELTVAQLARGKYIFPLQTQLNTDTHTYTHTHTYIYIYIYVCVCIQQSFCSFLPLVISLPHIPLLLFSQLSTLLTFFHAFNIFLFISGAVLLCYLSATSTQHILKCLSSIFLTTPPCSSSSLFAPHFICLA
ncbi:hypothetical protein, unlikely [Trypanosoma brucei gambiense DAL972]|uniref:Uncharacterized protein n=1 Tax=Trypanosoma brucei gambiense (strain MHOM/CI/86/DAL972) TaxID=679716 RepID=C9ZUS7_TRYB9|nr:hypothetical protein, unlikely [Trypanosoma brucei gambiense DAL972]CBH13165.1 hypothetical protein, unlikely [Trypanosoma brucei gambiense DAL972]|eukprot:XP_011775442.1 hypothetical protein, unlikely [Trypanosoma brucei gambiense DAL972]